MANDKIIKPFLTWMGNVMCNVVQLRVPVRVDFKTGYNWAELKDYLL